MTGVRSEDWGAGLAQRRPRRPGPAPLPGLFVTLARIAGRWRRWKRSCLLLLLGLLFLCLVLCLVAAFLTGRASAQGAASLPLDVLLLIDHSNSMWDKGGVGSDPDLLRVQAAHLFIAYLGVDTARSGNRLGVIHFGGESVLAVPLTPLDSARRRQAIRSAIANPPRMDWTDPLKALQLAYETLFPRSRRDATRQPVVILLSDGKPELSPAPSSEERTAYVAGLRALVARFHEQRCPIFTIALSNEATDADAEIQTVYRNLWQEIAARTPPAQYHEARTAGDLLPIYHAVVARLAGAETDVPIIETTVDGEATRTIVVEDGLAQVTFVVLRSDPALEVHLLRPGGALARPDDPDVQRTGEPGVTREEVWAITDPRPGRWTLELRGQGTALVWRDTIPQAGLRPPAYVIEVAALPAYVPAGQPLDVGVSVREASTGEPVAGPGLQVVAEARRAGFAETTLLARDDGQGCDAEAGDGRYCASLPDPPPGVCSLLLRALLDGEEIARREVACEVLPLPALEVVSPHAGLSLQPAAPICVEVRASAGDRPFDAQALAAQGTLTASLDVSGAGSVAVPLEEAGGAYVGHAIAPGSPGPFTLTVRLHGQTPEGLPFEDVARVSLEVASPSETRFFPKNLVPPLIGLAVLGGVGGLLIRRRRQRVTLEGGLRVLAAPSGEPTGGVIDLPGLPSVVLGRTDEGAVPLPQSSTACSTAVPPVILRAGRTPEGDAETWVAPLAGEGSGAIALNGRPLETARRLRDGDVLTLGGYRLRYESLRQAGARRARHRPSASSQGRPRRKEKWIGGVR